MIWSTLGLLLMGNVEAKPIPDAEYKLKLDPYGEHFRLSLSQWSTDHVSVGANSASGSRYFCNRSWIRV